MKRFSTAALGAVLVALCLFAAPARAAGPSANVFPAKSPLRYVKISCPFAATTSNITAQLCGALPPGGAILRDVVVIQNAAGAGGTSWVAAPKRATVALTSTNGGWTRAAGASKAINTAASPMGAMAAVTGGTRPVISGNVAATGTATFSTAVATNTLTVNGVTFTAVASGATGNQFNIGADDTASAANLAAAINASTSPAVKGSVTASSALGVVTITARAPGTGGNAITLAETGDGITVSGEVLSGGFNALSAGGELVTLDVTLAGSYSGGVSGQVDLYFEPRN